MAVRTWTIEAKGTLEIRTYPTGAILEITEQFDKYESDDCSLHLNAEHLNSLAAAAKAAAAELSSNPQVNLR